MREIPIYRSDLVALVDDSDYARLAVHKWYLFRATYACRTIWNGKQNRVALMHRDVLGLQNGDGLEIDHINRDGLDNRRANLRIATRKMQIENRDVANRTKWDEEIRRFHKTLMMGIIRAHSRRADSYGRNLTASFARARKRWIRELLDLGLTFNEVGMELGLSRERIRQLALRAGFIRSTKKRTPVWSWEFGRFIQSSWQAKYKIRGQLHRHPIICDVCGMVFPSEGKRKRCSEQCQREQRRRYARQYARQHKPS